MKTQQANTEDKKRKFLLVLPILILPFLLLIVWALGGGKSDQNEQAKTGASKVNMALPDATFDQDNPQDKMSFYAQARVDSNKRTEQTRNDPYFNSSAHTGPDANFNPYGPQALHPSVYGNQSYTDPNEAKIYRKLGELNSVLNQPAQPVPAPYGNSSTDGSSGISGSDLDRLENMMGMMQQGSENSDPEMQQINSMLQKIMDIQHPELAQDKINAAKDLQRGQVYAVTGGADDNPVTVISVPAKGSKQSTAGFYSLSEATPEKKNNTIAAVIHDNQTIVSGSIVKMRLANDIMVHGALIPKDNFIFGQAQISGERLNIEITSIRYNNSIYPVQLSVCDLDGMDGIHIPGAISRDVAKESGTDAMQGIGMNSFDPGLAAQAASAGIELSKNLIKKKVKLVKVTLKAGYRLLLKDEKLEESN